MTEMARELALMHAAEVTQKAQGDLSWGKDIAAAAEAMRREHMRLEDRGSCRMRAAAPT